MPRGEKSARRYLWHEKNPTRRAIYRCFLSVLFSPSLFAFPFPSLVLPKRGEAPGSFPTLSPMACPPFLG